jgi:hypothetical protein
MLHAEIEARLYFLQKKEVHVTKGMWEHGNQITDLMRGMFKKGGVHHEAFQPSP